MNITGILFGLFTLLAIGLGFVRVILVFFVLSLLVASNLTSAALGILGMTTIWDGTELYRQENRIRRGHALANPDRPVEPRRECSVMERKD